MDVINAAKKISEAGTKLDKLSRQIADQCPESRTKDDMLAYLDRIALYCHQLNITSKVKADVQNISGELIVSGVCIELEEWIIRVWMSVRVMDIGLFIKYVCYKVDELEDIK